MSRFDVDTAARASLSLDELVTFERLLADLSAQFANISGDSIEDEIERALMPLIKFLDFDRSNFWEFEDGRLYVVCSAAVEGVIPLRRGPVAEFMQWYGREFAAGRMVTLQSADQLPPEAAELAEWVRRDGVRAQLGIPLRVSGRTVGAISFGAYRTTREWQGDLITRLKLAGEVMAQALVRRRSEAALRASEERWRSVFQASNLGITIIDREFHYIEANRAFLAMLGYTDKELRKFTLLDVAVQEDIEVTRARLAELQQGRLDHYDVVRRYRRKDGTVMWGHSYISVASYAGSKPDTFIGTTIDITESKRAQDVLRATQAELSRITQLTTVGEMAASISHKLKQPLAAIMMSSNAALRWLANSPPDLDEARAMLNLVVNDGHRANRVIEGIRAMFKKEPQEVGPVDIVKLIQEVIVLLSGELQSQRIYMQTEFSENISDVFADRIQLQQVILNLVMNAIEWMRSLSDRTRVLRTGVTSNESGDVHITIQDSGVGIDAKIIDRIFDAFFTTKSSGMGMGLAICRSIIVGHKGHLWASSPGANHGSTFHVVLPLAQSPPPAIAGNPLDCLR